MSSWALLIPCGFRCSFHSLLYAQDEVSGLSFRHDELGSKQYLWWNAVLSICWKMLIGVQSHILFFPIFSLWLVFLFMFYATIFFYLLWLLICLGHGKKANSSNQHRARWCDKWFSLLFLVDNQTWVLNFEGWGQNWKGLSYKWKDRTYGQRLCPRPRNQQTWDAKSIGPWSYICILGLFMQEHHDNVFIFRS